MEPFRYGYIVINISQFHDKPTYEKAAKACKEMDKAKKELLKDISKAEKKKHGKMIYDSKEEIKSLIVVGVTELTESRPQHSSRPTR